MKQYRNQRKALALGGSQDLREHEIDRFAREKGSVAVDYAKGEEISMKADVVECPEVFGPAGAHAHGRAKTEPLGRS